MSEDRLEHIETKITYLEHTVEDLNKIVYAQQKQIDRQQALIDSLVEHVRELVDAAPERAPGNERPPHY
jgi:SlyX protein